MTLTRLPPSGLLDAAGAGVVAGGTRGLATAGAALLPSMVLLFAAPAPGAGAGAEAALLLLELPRKACARDAGRAGGAAAGAGAGAGGGMGYGDETGIPMRARSG